LANEYYKKKNISERHRHRYEVNSELVSRLEFASKGFVVSGRNPESNLIEIMEMDKSVHPYFVATQAHPEFKSRLTAASPLFFGLIENAAKKKFEALNTNSSNQVS
jgi:CTP synthase